MKIIGVDCATQPIKTGLALGEWKNEECNILEVRKVSRSISLVDILSRWLEDKIALISMDAPLGWPIKMAGLISTHKAGQSLDIESDFLFSRDTDRFVYKKTGKRPLDVGADKIARTALSSINLLGELRTKTGMEIPLAWTPEIQQTSVIEVYPAATLKIHGFRYDGYKGGIKKEERKEIIRSLDTLLKLPEDVSNLERNDDLLDAVICVLSGLEFLTGNAYPPEEPEIAEKEGWIWIKKKNK